MATRSLKSVEKKILATVDSFPKEEIKKELTELVTGIFDFIKKHKVLLSLMLIGFLVYKWAFYEGKDEIVEEDD